MKEEHSREEELTNVVVEAVEAVEAAEGEGTQTSATGRLRPG
jgi:hypothetical protein